MVKIPSLDDLKKAGAGFVDSAKSVKFNEMVGKVKSGIESVGANLNKKDNIPQGDEGIKNQFQALYASLAELMQAQTAQAALTKKVESQLSLLARALDTSKQEAAPATEQQTTGPEEKKDL